MSFISFFFFIHTEDIYDETEWVDIPSNEEIKKINDEERLATIERRSPERIARINEHRTKTIDAYNKSELGQKNLPKKFKPTKKLTFENQPETDEDLDIRSISAKKQSKRMKERMQQRNAIELAKYKNSLAGKFDTFKNKVSNWWNKGSANN